MSRRGGARTAALAASLAAMMIAVSGSADAADPVPTTGLAWLRLEVEGLGNGPNLPPEAELSVYDEDQRATAAEVSTDDMSLPGGSGCPGVVAAVCAVDRALTVPTTGTRLTVSITAGVPGTVAVFSGDCETAGNSPTPKSGLVLAVGETRTCRVSFAWPDDEESGANAVLVVDKTIDLAPLGWNGADASFDLSDGTRALLSQSVSGFRPLQALTTCEPVPTTRTSCEWVAAFTDPGRSVRLVETAPGWFPLFGGDCSRHGELPHSTTPTFYRYGLFRCSVENVLLEDGDPEPDAVLRLELAATAATGEGAAIDIERQNGLLVETVDLQEMLGAGAARCYELGTTLCGADVGVSVPPGSADTELTLRFASAPADTTATATGDCRQLYVGGSVLWEVTVTKGLRSSCKITLTVLPPPRVSVGPVTTTEGDVQKTIQVPVSLNRPAGRSVTVPWSTTNGTAQAPSDYVAASGTVSFAVGQSTATIPVTIVGDIRGEPTESFTVDLGTPTHATLGTPSATVTITNDDDTIPPVIEPKPPVVVEARLAAGQTIAVVYKSPAATDAKDGAVPVGCVARSGSAFPLGTALVRCTATDANFNNAISTFEIVVRLPTTSGAVTNPGNAAKALTQVSPGRRVRVTAGGFAPGSQVQLLWVTAAGDALPMGAAGVDAAGRFDARPKIPSSAPLGDGQVVAVGSGPAASEFVRGWRLAVVP